MSAETEMLELANKSASIVIDKKFNGISVINFDPNSVQSGVVSEAKFIITDAEFRAKNKQWAEFTCQGIRSTRFKLKYWYNEQPDIQSLIGKICVCDIVKDNYGFSTQTLPEVIDEMIDETDFDISVAKIREKINSDEALSECLNKYIQGEKTYSNLFLDRKFYHQVIKLGIQLSVADDILKWFQSANRRCIYGGLIFKSMEALFTSAEVEPDFLIYQNIYSRIWDKQKYGSIAKYFVKSYLGSDINNYIINIIENTANSIISGGALC